MNNKLGLARRIAGYKAAEDIIAPLTGELLAAKGEKINTAKANEIDAAGVTRVVVLVERKGEESIPVIVISNGCVDAQPFFSFDVEAECGINERANFAEIRKILDATSDPEEQKELLYNFSFGRSFKTTQRKVNNSDNDSGVMSTGK